MDSNTLQSVSSDNKETRVVYGTENIINQTLQFFPKIKERYDICTDCEGVPAFVETRPLETLIRIWLY
jgi:hypothetical protein